MAAGSQLRLVAFGVSTELFVLDIMGVRQIIPYTGSTQVPQAPDFVEGIIVLRHEVVPVIDLRSRLYPSLPPFEQQPLVLITRTSYGLIGLKVDEVRRIVSVDADEILPAPPLVRGLAGELFIGVIAIGQTVYLLLDLDTILTPDEQASLKEASFSVESAAAVDSGT